MSEDANDLNPTLALNTKLEEDFVSPLTAVRGSLEILRDFSDLTDDERRRFVERALRACARLEQGVEQLTATVYAAGQRSYGQEPADAPQAERRAYADRVHLRAGLGAIEVDFSDFEFSSSKIVNEFFDAIDDVIESTGRDWYFVVNYRDCSIWPEAWVAFAHRGKMLNVTRSLGTVRFAEAREPEGGRVAHGQSLSFDRGLFKSRDAAFAKIEEMKTARTA